MHWKHYNLIWLWLHNGIHIGFVYIVYYIIYRLFSSGSASGFLLSIAHTKTFFDLYSFIQNSGLSEMVNIYFDTTTKYTFLRVQ